MKRWRKLTTARTELDIRGWVHRGGPPVTQVAVALIFLMILLDPACPQNIIGPDFAGTPANPIALTDMDVSEAKIRIMHSTIPPHGLWVSSVQAKLDRHVAEFLEGYPWKPLHHTLGISGYEVGFDHPQEMFYALSLAMPYLSEPVRRRTRDFLAAQLEIDPPYAQRGWPHEGGRPREAYTVPDSLRSTRLGQARSLFGVYAFWCWTHFGPDPQAVRRHWQAILQRTVGLLAKRPYPFDPRRRDYRNDEAQVLNGDLAGLIGLARLARLNHDSATEGRADARLRELLELRVNLDRVNPQVLDRTRSASKELHNYKLARYCDFVPEVGEAVRTHTDGLAARRLQAFRLARPGWFMAYGDRLVGGENYTNPLHFSRALFAGAALIEQVPASEMVSWLDVPWCPGDFYFIEKAALVLWASAGRPWTKLP